MLRLLCIITLLSCLQSCQTNTQNLEKNKRTEIDSLEVDFWNGNRSEIRQHYESDVLQAVLEVTSNEFGAFQLIESRKEYPGVEESRAFSHKKHDVLVTVAGNQKFKENEVIMISKPLAKNLLGYRIPIIKEKNQAKLANAKNIKKLVHGIPKTWSDATIFKYNEFAISEEGDFSDIFERLTSDNFDYTTFGANEVKSIYQNRDLKNKGLVIEESTLLFYPFPLVFYVNPKNETLAKRINTGLQTIEENGTLDAIFQDYYGSLVKDLNLTKRELITLSNPLIPKSLIGIQPNLVQAK